MADSTPAAPEHPRAAATGTAKGEATVQAPSRTQLLVARRAAESRATVPDFTLAAEVDAEEAVTLHPELVAPGAPPHHLDALVVRACALALRAVPRANGAWRDAQLETYARVNVGVTIPVAGTLVVPTVFDADAKEVEEIAAELATATARAHAGQTTQPELSGGTFTVSNLGSYGTRSFAGVIIPPQAGILAVGALARRALVHEGELRARWALDLTLSADHRVLYGAEAAQFLEHVRRGLEAPGSLGS